jgi:hypothetical protein
MSFGTGPATSVSIFAVESSMILPPAAVRWIRYACISGAGIGASAILCAMPYSGAASLITRRSMRWRRDPATTRLTVGCSSASALSRKGRCSPWRVMAWNSSSISAAGRLPPSTANVA